MKTCTKQISLVILVPGPGVGCSWVWDQFEISLGFIWGVLSRGHLTPGNEAQADEPHLSSGIPGAPKGTPENPWDGVTGTEPKKYKKCS